MRARAAGMVALRREIIRQAKERGYKGRGGDFVGKILESSVEVLDAEDKRKIASRSLHARLSGPGGGGAGSDVMEELAEMRQELQDTRQSAESMRRQMVQEGGAVQGQLSALRADMALLLQAHAMQGRGEQQTPEWGG